MQKICVPALCRRNLARNNFCVSTIANNFYFLLGLFLMEKKNIYILYINIANLPKISCQAATSNVPVGLAYNTDIPYTLFLDLLHVLHTSSTLLRFYRIFCLGRHLAGSKCIMGYNKGVKFSTALPFAIIPNKCWMLYYY